MTTVCACTTNTGCGEYDEAGCDYCRALDPYLPCPVLGFMCEPYPGDGPCPCCTPEQQESTRQYYAKARGKA